ncbi:HAD family hydrolase [Kribbella antibiotica]|uniref:HAD family hydrolase n=1 Tax=Kribbella antibiotica TaxID=190195 RepID=A0A4V2YQP1_9ACTN|nr:HAD family hydrolase [Kribbella antibiotica]TDD62887.1 HAD family hydrolase [Kribbella antibiotica]
MTKIEAVLFDWGGTLATWHDVDLPALWRSVAVLIDEERADELTKRLIDAENSIWMRSRDQHLSGTLAEVCLLAEIEMTEAAQAQYELGWTPHTILEPDALETLRGLRERGLKVGVLSNTMWERRWHEEIFARDGVLELLDGAVYTSEIPYTKPHPEAFLAAMKAVGVANPAACLYVGDRLFDDVWGAQNAGMRAAHVPHSAIPASQIGHTEGTPDATVHRLAELLPLIDAWN